MLHLKVITNSRRNQKIRFIVMSSESSEARDFINAIKRNYRLHLTALLSWNKSDDINSE